MQTGAFSPLFSHSKPPSSFVNLIHTAHSLHSHWPIFTMNPSEQPQEQQHPSLLRVTIVLSAFYLLFIIIPDISISIISLLSGNACDKPLLLFLMVYAILFAYTFLLEKWVVLYIRNHPNPSLIAPATPSIQSNLIHLYSFSCSIGKLALFGWYIAGNAWFYQSSTCSATNPLLFYTVLANLVLTYVVIALPVTLTLLAAFIALILSLFHTQQPQSSPSNNSRFGMLFSNPQSGFMNVNPEWWLPVTKGLSAQEMSQLKTVEFYQNSQTHSMTSIKSTLSSPDQIPSTDKQTCAICCTDYTKGDKLRVLSKCQHRFHKECVDVWLKDGDDGFGGHRTCPICMSEVI